MAISDSEVQKFLPLTGYQKLEELTGKFQTRGDAVPEMASIEATKGHAVEQGFYDGPSYFARLIAQMDELIAEPTEGIFWMHGWYYQLFAVEDFISFTNKKDLPPMWEEIEPSPDWSTYYKADSLKVGTVLFADRLQQMRLAGVDVRIIGWIPAIMFKSRAIVKATNGLHEVVVNGNTYDQPGHIFDRNVGTLHSLLKLRGEYLDRTKVIFNTLTHPLGGAHTKFVVAGNKNFRRTFIGGIDAGPSRNKPTWSDAAVALQGKAATVAGQFFVQLWNEITSQTAISIRLEALKATKPAGDKTPGLPIDLPDATYVTHFGGSINLNLTDKMPVQDNRATVTDAFVQLFRTIPVKKYAPTNATDGALKRISAGYALGKKYGLSQSERTAMGLQVGALPHVWTPPISFARSGIFEYKAVMFKALTCAERYIYIMDQAPSNFEFATVINKTLLAQRKKGNIVKVIVLTPIHEDGDLEGGHGEMTEAQIKAAKNKAVQLKYRKQYEMFKVMAAKIPVQDYAKHFIWIDSATHAKVVMIDDKFVSIGSANFMLRSAYTDIEMGVSIMHETWVRDFRRGMWGWFARAEDKNKVPITATAALGMWSNAWATDAARALARNEIIPTLESPKVYGTWLPNEERGAIDGGLAQTSKFGLEAKLKPMVEDPNSNVII